jgi:hypothetical protein
MNSGRRGRNQVCNYSNRCALRVSFWTQTCPDVHTNMHTQYTWIYTHLKFTRICICRITCRILHVILQAHAPVTKAFACVCTYNKRLRRLVRSLKHNVTSTCMLHIHVLTSYIYIYIYISMQIRISQRQKRHT